jgi:hypothetical protein
VKTGDLTAHADWDLPPPSPPVVIGDRVLVGNPLVHSSVTARRDALTAVSGYSTTREWQLDHDLYLRLHRQGVGLGRLPEPLVLKREHPDQHFERGGRAFERLWSAYRLQLDHTRAEPTARRLTYRALASGRLATRGALQLVRTPRRAKRPA